MTKLTEHFTLEELTHTDHREFDNTPNAEEAANENVTTEAPVKKAKAKKKK